MTNNKKQVVSVDGKKIVLDQTTYLSEGGQAVVHSKGGLIYKIYHDPKHCMDPKKLDELKKIQNKDIILPAKPIENSKKLVGYTMPFVENSVTSRQFSSPSYKTTNNITPKITAELVKRFQNIFIDAHKAKCILVDPNEMNVLINSNNINLNLIDADSIATPSFGPSAIADSIRDRLVSGSNYNEGSDWFSFAVVAFMMYINIHPYQSKHPRYKSKEWLKRMDDQISVFDSESSLTRVCNPLDVIPKQHLDWMKQVFLHKERNAPPIIGQVSNIQITPNVIIGSNSFIVTEVSSMQDRPSFVYFSRGNIRGLDKHEGKAVVKDCYHPQDIILKDFNQKKEFVRNGRLYKIEDDSFVEKSFTTNRGKRYTFTKELEFAYPTNTRIYNGCMLKNLVGNAWITIPCKEGEAASIKIPELNKHKILNGKCVNNFAVFVTEKNKKYHRFVIKFDKSFSSYKLRKDENIVYDETNFTVTDNGICIMLNGEDVELFVDIDQVKSIPKAPFDSSMPLYHFNGNTYFQSNKKIFKLQTK